MSYERVEKIIQSLIVRVTAYSNLILDTLELENRAYLWTILIIIYILCFKVNAENKNLGGMGWGGIYYLITYHL